MNNEFEKVLNSKKYDIAFSSKDLQHDCKGDYIIYDPVATEAIPNHYVDDEDYIDDDASDVLEFYQQYGFVPETFPSHQGKNKIYQTTSKV